MLTNEKLSYPKPQLPIWLTVLLSPWLPLTFRAVSPGCSWTARLPHCPWHIEWFMPLTRFLIPPIAQLLSLFCFRETISIGIIWLFIFSHLLHVRAMCSKGRTGWIIIMHYLKGVGSKELSSFPWSWLMTMIAGLQMSVLWGRQNACEAQFTKLIVNDIASSLLAKQPGKHWLRQSPICLWPLYILVMKSSFSSTYYFLLEHNQTIGCSCWANVLISLVSQTGRK